MRFKELLLKFLWLRRSTSSLSDRHHSATSATGYARCHLMGMPFVRNAREGAMANLVEQEVRMCRRGVSLATAATLILSVVIVKAAAPDDVMDATNGAIQNEMSVYDLHFGHPSRKDLPVDAIPMP
jgi:hypothetical protein